MPEQSKIFQYQVDGLSYTVTVYEKDGQFFADVLVNEGAMDVNAVYLGDNDFAGASDSLNGPLNMNGAGSEYLGEAVQWDEAIKLSDPGLGKAGAAKETYVSTGETLTISLPIESLDDIDFFGIRATSTTTEAGSIKAVSGDPETPEEPEDPLHEKVFFDYGVDEAGASNGGVFILSEEPETNEFNVPFLPEGDEPVFDNFLAYFEELGGNVADVQSMVLYDADEAGVLQETLRIEAPEGGFADAEALLDAYDAAIAQTDGPAGDIDPADAEALELMAALTFNVSAQEDQPMDDADAAEEDVIF